MGWTIKCPCLKVKVPLALNPFSIDAEIAKVGAQHFAEFMEKWFMEIAIAKQVKVDSVMCFFTDQNPMPLVKQSGERLEIFTNTGVVVHG